MSSRDSARASGESARASSVLRRNAVGADNARRLLLTVMGEFVLPNGGMAWTKTFLEVLSRLDIEQSTVRQALARSAAAGWIVADRVGRRTRWRLTPAGEQLLVEGTERIYGFTGYAGSWDGRWLIVLASVPETDRSGRHLLRTGLSRSGLGSPSPGIWIGTNTSRLRSVDDVLSRLGVTNTAQVFVAEHRGAMPAASMVAQAWDLRGIEAEYEAFIDQFRSGAATDPLVRVIELVHAWRRFPWRDPSLPAELLPSGWKGVEAAQLFQDLHQRWAGAATKEWLRISCSFDQPALTATTGPFSATHTKHPPRN